MAEAAADAFAPTVDGADILGLGGSLVIVIGAVLLVGWLYSRSQSMRGAGGNVIRILAAQPLGSKERIVLVDVGGTQLVVGMTSSQVQTLHVFDEPILDDHAQPAVASAFSRKLGKLLKGERP